MPIMLTSPLSMELCCKTLLVSIAAVLRVFSPATLFAFSLVSAAVPIRRVYARQAAPRGDVARQRSMASRLRFCAVAVSSTWSPHIRGR
jgi:hypothetical protein